MKTAEANAWIQTYSGIHFNVVKPRVADVHLVDIAHALSGVNRFAGHTYSPYSVADHSVRVSELCSLELALWGLFHDAAEAYTNDISRPIKLYLRANGVTLLDEIEARLLEVIAARFELEYPVPTGVWFSDNTLLATEARDLLPGGPIEKWTEGLPQPLPEKIIPFSAPVAAHRFMRRAAELGIGVM